MILYTHDAEADRAFIRDDLERTLARLAERGVSHGRQPAAARSFSRRSACPAEPNSRCMGHITR
ncbi:hypothetical protein [Streptomyces sp. PR69]|uniref:hypothetical protein n=1 Tax=Streptomyces sp. PR69 TaxID=2984950 RepID=UPI002264AE29|nr:hypothetical protein [Streptomyces sp. PR69]